MPSFIRGSLRRLGPTALRLAGAGLALTVLSGAMPVARTQTSEPSVRQAQVVAPHWSARMGPSDQRFIEMMVPHHDGAIAMADLALTRARRPEIKELARSIKVSQTRENEQMRRWYRQWFNADLPKWEPGIGWGWHRGGMMGGMGMPGSAGRGRGPWMGTNLAALKQASDFDRVFIEQMIPHHQMGVMMATMELNSSQRPEMRKLAEDMVRVQSDEINKMQRWYRNWYS